jgi:hypothetical protein
MNMRIVFVKVLDVTNLTFGNCVWTDIMPARILGYLLQLQLQILSFSL